MSTPLDRPIPLEPPAERRRGTAPALGPDGVGTVATPEVCVEQDGRIYAVSKRAFDIALALVAIVLTSPCWLVAAILVAATSRGPVIFGQARCGKGGRRFTCYKFRTMRNGAHAQQEDLRRQHGLGAQSFKLPRDPRVTPVGRWLRRFSIDELPQLLNVLRREMSIVGPRPPIPEEVQQYTPRQLGRLAVKPGLICIWQVSGRSTIPFERWVELDLEYILRRSFWLDCWLVLRSVPAVLSGRGAY